MSNEKIEYLISASIEINDKCSSGVLACTNKFWKSNSQNN